MRLQNIATRPVTKLYQFAPDYPQLSVSPYIGCLPPRRLTLDPKSSEYSSTGHLAHDQER